MSFYISGTGSCLPQKKVTNDDLSKILDTSDEWITSRTGISERRVLSSETLLDIAAEAGRNAMENAGTSPADIDMILCATLSGDFVTPSMSCLLKDRLGSNAKYVYDVNMACSGFVFALEMASVYFDAGKVNRVLVVCAEAISRLLDWNDRSSAILFGDGAGAVVLEKGDGLKDLVVNTKADSAVLHISGVESNSPFSEGYAKVDKRVVMDGQGVFIFAVSAITDGLSTMIEKNGLTPDDISMYLLHQANTRIINSARKRFGQPEEKFPHNIEKYGNTSSASIPILLDEVNRSGKLKKNDKIILGAFGAGLSTGFCLIEWQK